MKTYAGIPSLFVYVPYSEAPVAGDDTSCGSGLIVFSAVPCSITSSEVKQC